ncbi:prepilin-type N-terminal cleavage/methylation domain-containing protein [Marinobacter nauticus]|uniref:Prepilin-type N-terminal cleavage/methylation domain-containing protein n=1 Tax=Marinobacter nauticus (strain ATCC 700491 / DSM 11845 / VT8) TaxID=351348 RepID=A1U400_MARN8|nr:prepilin-type N-terminal cleavage/methylation domain-containing protein [Marinobacter nauticus]ABM19719.1 hypothetical protein Maqu_2644 [Marinobacter nauticus VT8]
MSQHSERGMTLMELLVAMVIGSLVITLVVRGLGLTLNLYDRVAYVTSSMDTQFRESRWWADSLGSLVPCTDLDHCLVGTSSSLKGYSLAPVLEAPGLRTEITWELQGVAGATTLVYKEHNSNELAMSLSLPQEAEFRYLGPDGRWSEAWNTNGENARLPDAIIVEGGAGDTWLYAKPGMRPYGREDYRDMLGIE